MLRLTVLILLLANGLYFVWGEGMLRGFGYGPAQQREPQRVAQQIAPEAVRVYSPADMKRIEAQVKVDQEPKECLQAGPFDEAQTVALRSALATAFPTGFWQLDSVVVPARWIVYFGKFASDEAMARKRGEVAALNLAPQPLVNKALEPGFSVAAYESEARAIAGAERLSARGVRSAKVVQERPEGAATFLRFPALPQSMRPQIIAIQNALAGQALTLCRKSDAADN
jgi:hypothetical protein